MANTPGTFRAMRHRNFRLLWFGLLVSNAGAWMQAVAQGWLVYDLSGNEFYLGMIGISRAVPLVLLSLFGGTVADRMDKRKLLYVTQGGAGTIALAVGTLVATGHVQVWHIFVASFLSASLLAFDQPARHAMLPTLVPREDLLNAISLNSIAFNGAAVLGPSFVGALVPFIGISGFFFINAGSYIAVIFSLWRMQLPAAAAKRPAQNMWRDLIGGVRYVFSQPFFLGLIGNAATLSFFGRSYQIFLPVFASDVLHLDIGGLGILQAMPGLGTIIGSLIVASYDERRRKGPLLLAASAGFCLMLITFAWTTSFAPALVLLIAVGALNTMFMSTTNSMMQESVGNEMRGRVMSTYTLTALAMMPLGQGPMGFAINQLGVSLAVSGAAIIALGVTLLVFWRVPSLLRRRPALMSKGS